jgi:hypothetical protein
VGYIGYDNAALASGKPGVTWANLTGLYISRTSDTTFQGGYSTASGDTQLVSWTVTSTTMRNAIGFYADVRAITTYGDLDNLRIVPEPATMLLLGIGSILALRRRK